jgi:hypothetical protein
VQIPNPRPSVLQGLSTGVVILIPQSGTPRPVDLFVVSPPAGITTSFTPNPATNATELRITADVTAIPGEYPIRLLASSGATAKFANLVLTINNPASLVAATTTVPPSTTTIPPGIGPFGMSVRSDGRTLFVNGTLSYEIVFSPPVQLSSPINLKVDGLPNGVWAGFSTNPAIQKSTMFISTTVPVIPGTYSLALSATSGSVTQVYPVTLVIG